MRPKPFDYYETSSLTEALNLLSDTQDAKILAGGQSLMSLMKLRLIAPGSLIDINRIAELNYIREENGRIAIGALTRHDQLATNPLIEKKALLLAEAAGSIGDQQIRNRGSIGGSLAHADPSADLPTACTALNAEVDVASRDGSRIIAAQDFFTNLFTTALKENEIIKEVRIPIPSTRSGGAYRKLTKGHNDFALVAAAVQSSLGSDGACESISVVLGGVTSKPTHATCTENVMIGQRIGDGLIRNAALKASDGLTITPDPRVTSELKRELARRVTEKTLTIAFNRAREAV